MRSQQSSTDSNVRLELLPARHGDCVLVEWGGESNRHTMLVDAGPGTAYDEIGGRLGARETKDIDLLVLTHIDADHIEGTILLVNDSALALRFGDVWYNGARQLTNTLGPVQGEILSALISERRLPWNDRFDGMPVVAPDGGDLQTVSLTDGLDVTVLAPDGQTLRRLRTQWRKACKEAGLATGSTQQALQILRSRRQLNPKKSYLGPAQPRSVLDTSITNASSIVLLLEWGDVRVLLAGDSTPSILLPAIRRLLRQRAIDRLPITAFKVPHHGSANNMTAEIAELLPAQYYLISTDGSYFGHPDDAALDTLVHPQNPLSKFVFNYDNNETRKWDGAGGNADRKIYPAPGTSGAVLEIPIPND